MFDSFLEESVLFFRFLEFLRGDSWFMSMFILFVSVAVLSMNFIIDLSVFFRLFRMRSVVVIGVFPFNVQCLVFSV